MPFIPLTPQMAEFISKQLGRPDLAEEILNLEAKIQADTALVEIRGELNAVADQEAVLRIVENKRKLEDLYVALIQLFPPK